MYGFMDIGVLTTNNGNSQGQTLTKMDQAGGNFFPSMYGFTGTEDLGGGMKASFNLQGSLNVAKGQGGTTAAIGNGLFDRYSSVTLSGSAGSLELGRQIDLLFMQSFVNGVMPTHANSLAVNGLLAYGGDSSANATVAGSRISNAATYRTPVYNGLKASVMLGKGEAAGTSDADQLVASVVNYDAGSLSLSAGIETQKNATGVKAYEKTLVGAKYTIGNTTLAGQVHSYKNKIDPSLNDTDAFEIGVAQKLSSNFTVALNHENYDAQGTYKSPKVTSIKAKYDLSKRTYLYGMAAKYNADAAKSFYQGYAAVAPTAVKNESATNFAVGVVHGF